MTMCHKCLGSGYHLIKIKEYRFCCACHGTGLLRATHKQVLARRAELAKI